MTRVSRFISALFLFIILLSGLSFCAPVSEQVIVDQFGWRAGSKKVAILAKPITGQNSGAAFTLPANGAAFEVRRALDNSTAYAGTVTSYNAGATNAQSGDQVCWADFTSFATPGKYYIYDPTNNVQSYNFDIRDDIFNNILKTAGKFFYYQRCGINIDAGHGGNWNHTACHEGANQDLAAHLWNAGADQGQAKDVHGGWHDAGDFNKYVPFTLDAVFALMMAYELNSAAFGDDWNIAESGNGVPDVLDEIKYELDWMLRMQNPDGSVCNRVGVLNYVAAYPQNDSQARYYTLPTTWATSTLAGLAAHGARLFGAYNAQYSGYVNALTTAAQNAWAYLAANTAMTPASGADGGGSGGGAGFAAADGNGTAADDARRRLFAAAELYKTTGTAVYRTYFDSNYASATLVDAGHQPITSNFFDTSSSWIDEMGMIVYASISGYAVNAAAVSAIKTSLKNGIENNVVGNYTGNADPYRSYMWDGHYCWGSNQIKAQWASLPIYGIYLNVNPANNALYKECAEEYLHYFHGRNPLSYIYLSNMGTKGANLTSGKSCMQLYHGWFYAGSPLYDGASSTYGQAPGMLAGGANQFYDVSTIIPPASQPPQKSFKDWNIGWNGTLDEHSWEVTEPGIYYQAKYDLVLAYFAGPAGTPTFTPTNTPYAGSPTFTPTWTQTVTVTLTATLTTVPCAVINYDGETASTNLASGGAWVSVSGTASEVTSQYHSATHSLQVNFVWTEGWYSAFGWNWANWNASGNVYDATSAAGIEFWIRSLAGANTNMQVQLCDSANVVSNNLVLTAYLPGGATTTWQKVSIPMADFTGINKASLWEIRINTGGTVSGNQTIFFDDLSFTRACGNTPTNIPTQTPAITKTATGSVTSTASNTPSNTCTLTGTATPSFTPTQTYTATNTPTSTPTRIFTVTASSTYTESCTHTVSPTNTPYAGSPTDTPTVTTTATTSPTSTVVVNTPSFTYTATPTYTSTPTRTNTFTSTVLPDTFTDTPTCTMTQTPQPGATATYTQTPLNNTATATPTLMITPVSTTTAIQVKDTLSYPNPCNPVSGLTIVYKLTRDASEITFKLYTTSARLIRKHTVSSLTSAGIKTILISPGVLENLSQGVYFYVIEAKADNGTTARSKIEEIIIIK